jgi:hypothetical protein
LLTLQRVYGWSERRFPWVSSISACPTPQSTGYPRLASQTEVPS